MHNPGVVFSAPGRVELEECGRLQPGPRELLVETSRTLLSIGTELSILSGDFPSDSLWSQNSFPHRPGYSSVGVVAAVGSELEPGWIGRRVASTTRHARYTLVDVRRAYPIPPEVADESAAFFTIAAIVMNGIRRGRVEWGESVAIFGQGLLGQLATRFVRACGARPVLAIEPLAYRRSLVPDDPAVVAIDPAEGALQERVRELTAGRLADVAIETTGSAAAIPGQVSVLRSQGRLIVLGGPTKASTLHFHDQVLWPSLTIIGAHVASYPPEETPATPWTFQRAVELFFAELAAGTFAVDELITDRVRFAEAPALFTTLLQDRAPAVGAVIDWS